jgi:hypothetical protein
MRSDTPENRPTSARAGRARDARAPRAFAAFALAGLLLVAASSRAGATDAPAPAAPAAKAPAVTAEAPPGCCCIKDSGSAKPAGCSYGLSEEKCKSAAKAVPTWTATWTAGKCPAKQ